MKLSGPKKLFCIYSMSFLLSNLPHIALAETAESLHMIPTQQVLQDLTRAEAQSRISEVLNSEEVQQQLMAQGLSVAEAKSRLASLSDSEMKNFAAQIQQAKAGGDILFTILIVVLIIFLIKRL